MKLTRVQQAIKILNSSTKELQIEERPKIRKSVAVKKSKPTSKKSTK
jgi:hypothetical protein